MSNRRGFGRRWRTRSRGRCDSHLRSVTGVEALAAYSGGDAARVTRFTVEAGAITVDGLDADELRRWVDGHDPLTDERRGRELTSPHADLILDGTINAPKSYSIAALINPELADEFEALQDRLRDRIITTWQRELNARRGAGGRIRESLHRIEVVELQHRRSRALDPHIHRHLWLNVKVLGEDGKWSNVDSRVAMKLHTLINAEGELAARTDPDVDPRARPPRLHPQRRRRDRRARACCAAAVAALEPDRGEPREAARSSGGRRIPARSPTTTSLQQIDRLAWAKNRPNKPGVVDESEWEQLIRDELLAIDPALLRPRHGDESRERSRSDDARPRAARGEGDRGCRRPVDRVRRPVQLLRPAGRRDAGGRGIRSRRRPRRPAGTHRRRRRRARFPLTVDLLESEANGPGTSRRSWPHRPPR